MRRILAALSVGLFALQAQATTYTAETGNTFATRTFLPIGTDVVEGFVFAVEFVGDVDYFAFTDLEPGAAFTITMRHTDPGGPTGVSFFGFDADQNQLFQADALNFFLEPDVTGTVPAGGEIVIRASIFENAGNYRVTLDAPLPEPSTVLLLAGGLSAAWALSQRRRRPSA